MRTKERSGRLEGIWKHMPLPAIWILEEIRLRGHGRSAAGSTVGFAPRLLRLYRVALLVIFSFARRVVCALPKLLLALFRLIVSLPSRVSQAVVRLARFQRSHGFRKLIIAILRIVLRILRRLPRVLRQTRRNWADSARRRRRSLTRLGRAYGIARDEIRLLREGAGELLGRADAREDGTQGASAYLVYNSLPFHSAGYATRSHGLVGGLREEGIDVRVVNRLGYPQVFAKFRDIALEPVVEIDAVPYHRVGGDVEALFFRSTRSYLGMNIAATTELVRELEPAIVHGASNFVTGLTAVAVARQLGVPSVYEVRGLWEVTQASRDPSYVDTLHHAQAVKLETQACLEADRVIAITEALRDELVRRSVPGEKIRIVPNGVDSARFKPLSRDHVLAEGLGIEGDAVVVGYVGSILDYEGLDDLLKAARLLVDRGLTHLRLLIVGDGAAYETCRALARELDLEEIVIFTGRVPHEEVEAYYSLIDIAPFPRKPLPVCEMVSPLKPFEAMAMEKCVVVSSVAALAEIVEDRPIGLVHEKGNVDSLADTLARAIEDPDLRREMGCAARDFVVQERDWRVLAERVLEVYRELGVVPPAQNDGLRRMSRSGAR